MSRCWQGGQRSFAAGSWESYCRTLQQVPGSFFEHHVMTSSTLMLCCFWHRAVPEDEADKWFSELSAHYLYEPSDEALQPNTGRQPIHLHFWELLSQLLSSFTKLSIEERVLLIVFIAVRKFLIVHLDFLLLFIWSFCIGNSYIYIYVLLFTRWGDVCLSPCVTSHSTKSWPTVG